MRSSGRCYTHKKTLPFAVLIVIFLLSLGIFDIHCGAGETVQASSSTTIVTESLRGSGFHRTIETRVHIETPVDGGDADTASNGAATRLESSPPPSPSSSPPSPDTSSPAVVCLVAVQRIIPDGAFCDVDKLKTAATPQWIGLLSEPMDVEAPRWSGVPSTALVAAVVTPTPNNNMPNAAPTTATTTFSPAATVESNTTRSSKGSSSKYGVVTISLPLMARYDRPSPSRFAVTELPPPTSVWLSCRPGSAIAAAHEEQVLVRLGECSSISTSKTTISWGGNKDLEASAAVEACWNRVLHQAETKPIMVKSGAGNTAAGAADAVDSNVLSLKPLRLVVPVGDPLHQTLVVWGTIGFVSAVATALLWRIHNLPKPKRKATSKKD